MMRFFVQALRGAMTSGKRDMSWQEFSQCLGEVRFGGFSEYVVDDIMAWTAELKSLSADGLKDAVALEEELG